MAATALRASDSRNPRPTSPAIAAATAWLSPVAAGCCVPGGSSDGHLVAQLEDHALGGLASDPGHGGDQCDIPLGDGAHQRRELRPSEDPERRLRADALDADEEAKQAQLILGGKPVETDRVGADAGVHVQRHLLLARRVQRGDGAQVAEHLVPDTARVDDDVVVPELDEPTA